MSTSRARADVERAPGSHVVFVDTSVWVDYFRGRNQDIKLTLDRLLDQDKAALAAPVRIELLGGARKERQPLLRRLLRALPTYRPTDETWECMETWALAARGKGYHFGVGDLLVAAIAHEHNAPIWSLDSDFEEMAKLGLIRVHRRG